MPTAILAEASYFSHGPKSWHALKVLFLGFLNFIYFIELKFIDVENSVCNTLSLYVSYHPQAKLFVKVFFSSLIDYSEQSFGATEMLRVVLKTS